MFRKEQTKRLARDARYLHERRTRSDKTLEDIMGNHNPSNDRSQDTKQAQKTGMPDQNRPGQQEQQVGQHNQDRNKDNDRSSQH